MQRDMRPIDFDRRIDTMREAIIVAGVLGLAFGLIVGFLAAIVLGVS